MKPYLLRLWTEDDGFVLSSEMVMYGTVGVVGVTTGYTALRDSINTELDDVAQAIGSTDQSYYYGGVYGHSAWSAGSAFFDRVDRPDLPKCVMTPGPVVDRPTVCADVFGPAHPAVPALPQAAPRFVDRKADDLPPPKKDEPRKKPAPKPQEEARIPDPQPAVVVGAPDLAPCAAPAAGCFPVRVMFNPHGPCMVNLPEGYFNHGLNLGAPCYQMCGPGPHGYVDYGYSYAPVAPGPAYHQAPHHGHVHAAPGVLQPNVPGPNTIDLGFTTVGDAELKNIEKFTTARCLHVLGSAVTNKGLDSICELEQLESLHIVGTQITDEGLDELEDLKKLRFLHLVGTRITDKGLAKLSKLKSLEELDLRATPVSDEAIEALKLKMPTLRVVR
jgi:hypothetical protein